MPKLLHFDSHKKFKANKLGIYLQQIKTLTSWLDFKKIPIEITSLENVWFNFIPWLFLTR